MIRINQLKMPLGHDRAGLLEKAARVLRVPSGEIEKLTIVKQSVDARKKPDIWYSYVVDIGIRQAGLQKEEKLVRRLKDRNVSVRKETPYRLPEPGTNLMASRPVIIGTGPAGLFCGLMLARKGYMPILLERGEDVDARTDRVARFWETGQLNPSSNVQFGEGGAGTFSDGKLNTLVKDTSGRNREVLRILTEFGGDPSILYVNKPHIGTDILRQVVKTIRQELISLGCDVRFGSCLTGLEHRGGQLSGIWVEGPEGRYRLDCDALVLAPGHSARDTFRMLEQEGVPMEQKSFAIGVRIEHKQKLISQAQYGPFWDQLPPTDYKLACHLPNGRSAFTFCVCPGGQVVASASEPGQLVTNGMSYRSRDGENINGGFLVGVGPEDFQTFGADPLAGVRFQEQWERAAFQAGGGGFMAPAQRVEDFLAKRASQGPGEVRPTYQPGVTWTTLEDCLPDYVTDTLRGALPVLDRKLHGFAHPDGVLTGVETRSSSPVRIVRDETYQSNLRGLYPCGEGAGYAGGIVSAAVDGIRVAEAVARG